MGFVPLDFISLNCAGHFIERLALIGSTSVPGLVAIKHPLPSDIFSHTNLIEYL